MIEEIRQNELDYCKNNMIYFIENYVHIEDVDNKENILQKFKMWEAQKDTLKSIHDNRLNIILKARQLGISWLVLAYSAYCLMFNVGYLIIALSKTENDAGELVRRLKMMFSNMRMFIREDTKENANWSGMKYRATSLSVEILHKGKSSKFQAFASSRNAGRSFTANMIIFDEWAFQQFADEIYKASYPTINRPTGGKVIGISTIERGTLFERLFTEENKFNKLFIPWNADPRRTIEWYESTRTDMGDKVLQEYPATIEEALTIPGGSYFPEFKQHYHVIDSYDITPNDRIYHAIDYGLDKLAALSFAVGRRQTVGYQEIHEENLIVSQAAKKLLEKGIKEAFAPPDLWNRQKDTGKSIAELFYENGVTLYKVSNDLESGCMELKEYLRVEETIDEQTGQPIKLANLVFTTNCPTAISYFTKIQKDKNRPNIYSKDPHELTHIVDTSRYFASGRPKPKTPPKPKPIYNFASEKPKVKNTIKPI